MVRVPFLFLASALFVAGQSHPSWWNNASPNATALIGIDWQAVRASPFAEPIEAELWDDLGFPALPCLHNARQIVVSSPDMLALASGNFSTAAVHEQASKKGFNPMTYRGVDMWFATEKGVLSVARMNDQLLMIGEPKTLEMAVDRIMSDTKNYSPLLARAAKFAQKDLWVVSSQLPDDLANRFVTLDTEAQSFEGSLTVRGGLELDAVLTSRSEQEANASAEKLRKTVPTLPAIARGLQVTVEDDTILLALAATREQVIAALRGSDPVAAPVETIKVETPIGVERVIVENPAPKKPVIVENAQNSAEKAPEKSVEKPVEKIEVKAPEKPEVIRIVGLDDGPREIALPATKPEKKQP
jgi:hypothetical protein